MIIRHENAQTTSSGWFLDEETENAQGRPVGAVVVAQGADQLTVRLHLAQAVETFLGLDAQNVEVFAMKQEKEGQS